jgi:hypothetical protein
MKSPEEMEKALQRLVPPALSAQAHADVSAMLASLAAAASPNAPVADISPETKRPALRITARWAAAAAIVIAAISALSLSQSESPKLAATPTETPAAESDGSPILIDRMLVTDGIRVEGTMTAADGRVINQVNRRVETRERYRDAKKGYLITISETRDEKVYLPKKGF